MIVTLQRRIDGYGDSCYQARRGKGHDTGTGSEAPRGVCNTCDGATTGGVTCGVLLREILLLEVPLREVLASRILPCGLLSHGMQGAACGYARS